MPSNLSHVTVNVFLVSVWMGARQGRVQDLKKGSDARATLINAFASDREGPSIEKLLFRERILESSKFIRLSYQLLIISNNSCHSVEFAVASDLSGVLQPP
jgi:hypothetical protein